MRVYRTARSLIGAGQWPNRCPFGFSRVAGAHQTVINIVSETLFLLVTAAGHAARLRESLVNPTTSDVASLPPGSQRPKKTAALRNKRGGGDCIRHRNGTLHLDPEHQFQVSEEVVSEYCVKSDSELIQAALDGDASAYGELVERYHARLFSAMLPIVGAYDETEDVVQESFIQAYVKLRTFQGTSQFYTWLYRIAFNNALSLRRKARGDVSLEHSKALSGSDPQDYGELPEEPLLRQERIALVHRALARLTEDHRRILVLREMDNFTYEEIAEILSINIGTVRSRLSRAREQLRIQIQELEQESP